MPVPFRSPVGLLLSLFLALAAPAALSAQESAPGLDRAAPTATRLPDGRPGPGYWQQRVDYRLRASLDPASRTLRGSGTIVYHNRSPRPLGELHWHLYQNLFRADAPVRPGLWSVGARLPATRGITVRRVEAEGAALVPEVAGTRMRTPLPRLLAPGDSMTLQVEWEYEVPATAGLRTGASGRAFGMAQWYPQIAVYDDLRGWDDQVYGGRGEFYLEYGDWDVRLTVPGNYVVAATGTLENPDEVLSAQQAARLRGASADTVVAVIPYAETGEARDGLAGGTRTWRFRARDVRDFAWAAAPDFVWEATRARSDAADGARVQGFYRAQEAVWWEGRTRRARDAVDFFAERFGAYVYPQASVVSGPVSGMEYPMLAFVNPLADEETLVHELAHQWYPMMLGSHESRHPFMDEGFATFLTALALDDPSRPGGPAGLRLANNELLRTYDGLVGAAPAAVHADSAGSMLGYTASAYLRGGALMFMLGDLLGPDTLQAALREYHRRWLFRHPAPDDFFRTVEDVAGRDLDWFWRDWVYGTETLDLAIDGVRQSRTGRGWRVEVDLTSRGTATLPATVRLELADGSHRDVRVQRDEWRRPGGYTLLREDLPSRTVRVRIDPERILPDAAYADNRWPFSVALLSEDSRIRQEVAPALLLDRKWLSWHPAVGSNAVDGIELGFVSLHRAGFAEGRLQTLLRVGVRSGHADVWLGYQAPILSTERTAVWGAQFSDIDGRVGGDFELQLAERPRGQRSDSSVIDRRLWLGLHTVAVRDTAYFTEEGDWEDGWATAASARLRVPRPGWWGAGEATGRLEIGLPGSDWSYLKASGDLRTRLALTGATALSLRAYAGASLGDLPAQTAYALAQATPWERWALHRHARGRGDHFRLWGGGGVVGVSSARFSDRIVAANVSLETRRRWLSWGVFADAASNEFGALVRPDDWSADAGIGLGVNLPGGNRLKLQLPFWVRDAAEPDRGPWNFRWRMVVGGI